MDLSRPERMISVNFFEGLVLDESRIGGALMFRLAECISGIVVHESVKAHVEAGEFAGLKFVDPANWMG